MISWLAPSFTTKRFLCYGTARGPGCVGDT